MFAIQIGELLVGPFEDVAEALHWLEQSGRFLDGNWRVRPISHPEQVR